jgi:Tetratricopeptide repeat
MLSSIANLASTYRDQGRWNEAKELQVQMMKMMKRVLGQEHLHTLSSIANLAFNGFKVDEAINDSRLRKKIINI